MDMENQTNAVDSKPEKGNISQATFDSILNKIMNGTWKPGEKIPSENELKEMLGVSRHTVRSAITNLNMLGILETRRGSGNYVKATGVALYIDFLLPYLITSNIAVTKILEFRESIEATASRYAAMRATPEELEGIKEKMMICQRNSHNLEKYSEYDFAFHLAIAEASKSDLLIQSMYIIKKYCFAAIADYFDLEIALDGSDLHHTRIYNALCSRDSELACDAMGKHIRSINHMVEQRERSTKHV